MSKRFLGILIAVLCMLGLTSFAVAQELLTNNGFESWIINGPGGPPDNWSLSDDTLLVAARESGTVRSGSYSVALTCSTTYTRWLYQSVAIPVADSCYTFSCYAWDDDSLGRARVGIYWYASDDSTIVGSYLSKTYTTDQAAWQQLTTGSQKAPAGAAYMHGEIRIYDENADTNWREVDYLVIDRPPGTGDTQLTLAQKVPVSGAVIVTTPQDIALLDARKAYKMFEKVEVPVLGVVENMSIHICSKCGHEEHIFGEGGGQRMAEEYNVGFLGALPLDIAIRQEADAGKPTVVAEPDSRISQIYRDIARRTAAKLSQKAKDYSAKFPKIVISND